MARKFAEITFTPSVKAAQERYGSRRANLGFEMAEDPGNVLTEAEVAFIEARDGFYQASLSESGWPYVQFRGGPAGFLKVLDERTIGYADFRGNVQYLSVGNIKAHDRVALILMDYPNKRRLKVWAKARIVDYAEDPELIARLEIPTYRARVERAVTMTIEAFDWNCPQHITPRFTEAEIEEKVAHLKQRIAELEATRSLPGSSRVTSPDVIGDGPLELVITGVRQLTPEVRAYELRRPDHGDLPAVSAGSHLQVPVPGEALVGATRSYSISSNPNRRDAYEIAVRLDPQGRGGSKAIHEGYALGLRLRTSLPRNSFALHDDGRPAVLIAGGIGITPLKAMAQALIAEARSFQLYYAGRARSLMAYRSKLTQALDDKLSLYPSNEGERLDIQDILSNAPENAIFYLCGPERLIAAVRKAAADLGIDEERLRFESFQASGPQEGDQTFEVRLARSGMDLRVAADESLLDRLIEAGVDPDDGCQSGTCGTCAVKVLDGIPLHRDQALSDAERDQAGLICPCVSRASSHGLVLDL
jgi:ferredoxin-NADP reductase/predicted pyridoxine 5'-phosphate oxidase superfamily flavin-nucleotide-binding protein